MYVLSIIDLLRFSERKNSLNINGCIVNKTLKVHGRKLIGLQSRHIKVFKEFPRLFNSLIMVLLPMKGYAKAKKGYAKDKQMLSQGSSKA